MQLPLAHLDASAIEEIPLDVWSGLFDSVGWPGSLLRESLGYDAIRESFRRDEQNVGMLLALEAMHNLGTAAGRDALLAALRDRHVDVSLVPDGCGEREFAVRMFLLQRTEPSFADAFVRAQIHVQAVGEHKAVNEHWGNEARAVPCVQRAKARLAELMLAYCNENDLGHHVQVEAFEDDGTCIFQVIHSDRTRTPLAIVEGGATRSRIEYRPVHCDVIRYDAATGRLQVVARRATMVDSYVRLVGDAFFEDPTFFVGDAACTLKPLQEKGRAALEAHKLAGVGRVWMTECVWERGDRNVLRLRSHDCFEDIEHLGLPIDQEGRLIEVKLKVQIAHQGSRPATVTVRIPGKITVSNSRYEALAHSYLEAIGVRCRGVSSAMLDLWSLHPWRQPRTTWRAVFGDRVEGLAKAKALVPVQLESVPHPDLRGAGNALEVHPVEEGEFYGVGKEASFPSRSLSTTDVDGLELDASAFCGYLGHELALPEAACLQVAENVLNLGPVAIGVYKFRPFYLLSAPCDGLAARIRKAALGEHVVLLVPPGRASGSDLSEAQLTCPVPSRSELERALVLASGLEDQVPAIHCARDGARLVVDTRLGIVWVDRIKVTGLKPETHPFQFVEALARACPGPVSSAVLSKRLSRNRDDDTTAARHAKRDARKAIIEALAAVGRELDEVDPFPSASKGTYRCTLAADVR